MKDVNTIIKELITRAKELAPNFVWEPQTVVSRLFLSVPALEMSNLYLVAEYLHRLMSFEGLKSLLEDDVFKTNLATALSVSKQEVENLIQKDLEYFGERFNVKRKKATYSRGIVSLYFSSSESVSLPANTIFVARNGVEFSNLVDVILTPVFDVETGLYVANVLVQCRDAGTIGNIPAGAIIHINRQIPNLVAVKNPFSFISGQDEEDWSSYLERIKFLRFSTALGSKSWLESLIKSNENVLDAKVFSATDKEFTRRYGAEVWVVNYEELEKDSLAPTETEKYVLYPPCVKVVGPGRLIRKEVFEDVYSYSVFAVEKVIREGTGAIEFYYDKSIYYIQQVISDPEFWFFGGERNVVVRKALPAQIKVDAEIYPKYPVVDKELLKQTIINDLQVFFTGGITSYGERFNRVAIGSRIDASDVLEVILENPEVDRVDLATYKLWIKHYYANAYETNPLEIRLEFFEYPVFNAEDSNIIIK